MVWFSCTLTPQVFPTLRPSETRRQVLTVDEEEPTVQSCLPYSQGLGVVGRGVPGGLLDSASATSAPDFTDEVHDLI